MESFFSLPVNSTPKHILEQPQIPFILTQQIVLIFQFPDADGDDIHHTLPSGSLLEADEVLEQFLSTDDPLEEPDLNGPATLHCEICEKKFDNAKRYYGHLRVHSKDNLWICGEYFHLSGI